MPRGCGGGHGVPPAVHGLLHALDALAEVLELGVLRVEVVLEPVVLFAEAGVGEAGEVFDFLLGDGELEDEGIFFAGEFLDCLGAL